MNQRRNSPSETTYAQCGRQHFHPTFAVAMSAGSMIPAWPREQQHHPGRKGRVTNVHPERGHHPSGKEARRRRPTSILQRRPLVPPLLVMEESILGFPASWGSRPSVTPHMPMSPQVSPFPLPWSLVSEGQCGSPQAPPAGGEDAE